MKRIICGLRYDTDTANADSEVGFELLGGIPALRLMLGAHGFTHQRAGQVPEVWQFQFKARGKIAVNLCQIAYEPEYGLFNLELCQIRAGNALTVERYSGLYAGDVRRVFEKATGLCTNAHRK